MVYGDDQPFAIPQVNVLELVRLDGEKADKAIESIGRAKVHRLRGQLLPILDVRDALGLPDPRWGSSQAPASTASETALVAEPGPAAALADRLRARAAAALHREQDFEPAASAIPPTPPAADAPVGNDLRSRAIAALAREASEGAEPTTAADEQGTPNISTAASPEPRSVPEAMNIVVLIADNITFGLVVDRIDQTQEIVVKPLGAQLKDLPVYAGTTVMGDGHVALILDAVGLAKHSQIASVGAMGTRSAEPVVVEAKNHDSVLVCRVGGNRVALELPVINRLEFIAADRVERINGREVVQYHEGRLLQLVRIEEFLGRGEDQPLVDPEILRVIVCEHGDEYVGLIVDDILDIASRNVHKQQIRNEGIVTVSAVVGGKVTDLLDVDLILAAASTPALSRR
jgi:chemotaxis protein histidine kinase CheA